MNPEPLFSIVIFAGITLYASLLAVQRWRMGQWQRTDAAVSGRPLDEEWRALPPILVSQDETLRGLGFVPSHSYQRVFRGIRLTQPVWVYQHPERALTIDMITTPVNSSYLVLLKTVFPDDTVVLTYTPGMYAIQDGSPTLQLQSDRNLPDALRLHTEKVEALQAEHGIPHVPRTPAEDIALESRIQQQHGAAIHALNIRAFNGSAMMFSGLAMVSGSLFVAFMLQSRMGIAAYGLSALIFAGILLCIRGTIMLVATRRRIMRGG